MFMFRVVAFFAVYYVTVLSPVLAIRVMGTDFQQEGGLTSSEKQDLLDAHNAYRLLVAKGEAPSQPPASDMVAMEWDDRLARDAQNWANTCTAAHNDGQDRRENPYAVVGQNFAGRLGAIRAVKEWYDEIKDFDFYTDKCVHGAVCGHYMQVVWAKSVKIGCGYKTCGDMTVLFCHYAEGLNNGMADRDPPRPYKQGEPCSECPKGHGFCMEGTLCASRQACDRSQTGCECHLDQSSCRNGHFDGENCECVCSEEFEGTLCDKPCEDALDWCDQNEAKGYCNWDSEVGSGIWMDLDCRKTCQLCVPRPDPGQSNVGGIATNINPGILNDAGDRKETTTVYTGPCVDVNQKDCGPWNDRGWCPLNPEFMQEQCRKTCGFC